ncbi:phage tail protein [Lysinibacillus sp. NPDC096418]|uniref:phage tail protein n=1 Tax=Lysinibacillus sp. NPDC096418 TaxID=3364138 RepID=UPI00382DA7FE
MDPYVGEIRIFGGNYAPKDWAFCNGQLLSIRENTALFAIIGTYYGGDGKTNFALPNLNGRVAIHHGTGTGLTTRHIGEVGGETNVTLLESEIPSHNHVPNCNNIQTSGVDPTEVIWTDQQGKGSSLVYSTQVNLPMNPLAIQPTGGSQPHNNMQPYLGMNFIISLYGVFPPRS